MNSFWDDIALMESLTRIFWRATAVLFAIGLLAWLLQRPYFSINQYRIVGDVAQLEGQAVKDLMQESLGKGLSGGFFSMNLHDVQAQIKVLSWVQEISVRRVWPQTIEIGIRAHKPFSTWGDRYLSETGDVFSAPIDAQTHARLIVVSGPDASAKMVVDYLPKIKQWVAPLGWQLKEVKVTERYSWRLYFSNKMEIELGRADSPTAFEERLARLVKSSEFVNGKVSENGYIDLRYPNGFAIKTDKIKRVNINETKK